MPHTQLLCIIYDFFQKSEAIYWDFLKHNNKRFRMRWSQLKVSEIVFITIWYECSHFNNFKAFFFSSKQNLKEQDVELITYHGKNMQAMKLAKTDAYNLRQRNKVETLFSLLKRRYNLVISKARSIEGYLVGTYATLCVYQLYHESKPTVRVYEELA